MLRTLKAIVGLAALIATLTVVISVKDKPFKTRIDSGRLEDSVTLTVTFDPPIRREYPVRIEAFMNGVPLFPPFMRVESPWNHSVKVHKGAEIFLTAGQMHDGIMDCIITYKGKTVAHNDTIKGDDGRNVACWYQVGD